MDDTEALYYAPAAPGISDDYDAFNMPPPLEATDKMELIYAAVRCVVCCIVWLGTFAVTLHYRNSKIRGWLLFKLIFGVCSLLAVNYTWSFITLAVGFAAGPDSGLTTALSYVHYVLTNLAAASFIGLLLVLATGFCITRADLGPHTAQVIMMPSVMFLTGVVTDVIWYTTRRSGVNDVDFMEVPGWEAFLWFVCTLLNLSVLMLSWVYTFDILQQEIEAIEAQEKTNTRRMEAQAPDINEHAAPPPLDPIQEVEGVTYYKNLLGPGQNMSHVPGADVEAQEFQTVADRANFEIKKTLMTRLSYGIGIYLGATVGVMLLPIFINDYLQFTIGVAQFIVQMAFIVAMVWVFKPQDDSPYLMIGGDADETDALGMAELDTALDMELAQGEEPLEAASPGRQTALAAKHGSASATAASQQLRLGAAASGGVRSADGAAARDQTGGSGGASLGGTGVPPALPAIRTSPAQAGGAAAPPVPQSTAPAKFSLAEEEEEEEEGLTEISMSPGAPAPPVKSAEKKD